VSTHFPFRQWSLSSAAEVSAGWQAIAASATWFQLTALDHWRAAPAVPPGGVVEYDIPAPSRTVRHVRRRVAESPLVEIVPQARRLRGLSIPRAVREFSVGCVSLGAGFDITDLLGPLAFSGTISLPFFPSGDASLVELMAVPQASAADLTGHWGILEVGGSLVAGASVQVLFMGCAPFGEGLVGGRSSNGVDVQQRLRQAAGDGLSMHDRLVEFLASTLLPHGMTVVGGMNVGIGEMGISLRYALTRAHPIGSRFETIGLEEL
jgi:hypothetical protein